MPDEHLTAKEAAKLLLYKNTITLIRGVKAGKINAVRLYNGHYRFTRAYYLPRIKPACSPQGIPAWLRRHHPPMYRLLRLVQALEKHNRKVIEMRIHSDAQRHFRERSTTMSTP